MKSGEVGPDVWAVAIDWLSCRLLLNTGELVGVEDFVDDEHESATGENATMALYSIGCNERGLEWVCATDLDLLAEFTVH